MTCVAAQSQTSADVAPAAAPGAAAANVRAETLRLLKADARHSADEGVPSEPVAPQGETAFSLASPNAEGSAKPPEIIYSEPGGSVAHWLRTGNLFTDVGEHFTKSAWLAPVPAAGGFAGIGLAFKISW